MEIGKVYDKFVHIQHINYYSEAQEMILRAFSDYNIQQSLFVYDWLNRNVKKKESKLDNLLVSWIQNGM